MLERWRARRRFRSWIMDPIPPHVRNLRMGRGNLATFGFFEFEGELSQHGLLDRFGEPTSAGRAMLGVPLRPEIGEITRQYCTELSPSKPYLVWLCVGDERRRVAFYSV